MIGNKTLDYIKARGSDDQNKFNKSKPYTYRSPNKNG